MAAAKLVQIDPTAAASLKEGMDAIVLHANNDADAKAVAKAIHDSGSDGLWDVATVTDIVAADNWLGWRLRVRVQDTDGTEVCDITVTGAGSDDSIDEIAALMVTALNATSAISNASYNSGSQVLTIAAGGSDALGDHSTLVEWYPPAADVRQDVAIPGLVTAKVHNGVASDNLTATFAADGYAIPKVYATLRAVR